MNIQSIAEKFLSGNYSDVERILCERKKMKAIGRAFVVRKFLLENHGSKAAEAFDAFLRSYSDM